MVLLDWRLGDEDGLALCRTLRAEPAPPEVVLYTATADPGLDAQASAAGAHAVVEKSADIDELFDTCGSPCAAGAKRRRVRRMARCVAERR